MSEIAKLPLPDLTGKPKEPNWAWIEHEYRNGARSLREIARDAGISQPAISKRAKREGWTRLTPVITWADNQPDNQADNRGARTFPGGVLAEPAWAGRLDDEYWRSEDAKEDIVAHRQSTVAVYLNPHDQLVIRAEREWDRDEDTIIIIDKAHVPALLKRINELMRERRQP